MSKLFKREKSYFDKECFFEHPLTITFYKSYKKILRIRDVTHFLSLEDRIYLFGVGLRKEAGKYVVTRDEFDFAVNEYDFAHNYQFCKNMLRDFKIGRSGIWLNRRIKRISENYRADFLPCRFRDYIQFILRHYNYNNYVLVETIDLNPNSKKYLSVEMKLKERSKL